MTEEQKDAIRWARDVAIAGKWEHVKALQELLAAGASEGQAEPVAWIRKTDITELTDSEPETDGWTPLYDHRPFVDEFCKAYAEEWQDTLKEQSDCIKARDAEIAALRARIAELESKK